MRRGRRWRARVLAAALAAAAAGGGWPARARAAHAEVVPPRRLDAAPVPYPPMASGDATVVLVLVIDATGVVTEATVRQGEQPFAQAAIDAAKGWRFAPATRDESPVPARILATVSFTAPAPAPTPTPSLPSAAPAARVPPAPRPD